MPMRGAFTITSQSTAYRSVRGRRDLVEANLAEPRFEMKRVDSLLRALLRRLVLPADQLFETFE